MFPTREQIEVAAYHRWRRRGGGHGDDHRDWLEAEQDLLFALNYEVIARHRLDGVPPHYLGDGGAPRCRFCEQAPPRATFSGPSPALPGFLGNASLFTFEECDECRASFQRSVEGDL